MLTDEEILNEWGGSDATRPTLGKSKVLSFARAVIAAHEAKRMQPDEWLRMARDLLARYGRAQWNYGDADHRDYSSHKFNALFAETKETHDALIAHISTPPAGMVLVPEEPTQEDINAGLRAAHAVANKLAFGKEKYVMADVYTAALKAMHAHMIEAAKGETK